MQVGSEKTVILAFAHKRQRKPCKCLTHKLGTFNGYTSNTKLVYYHIMIIWGGELDHETCALLGYYVTRSGNSLQLGSCCTLILM